MRVRDYENYFAIFRGGSVDLMDDGHGGLMSHCQWEKLKEVMDEVYSKHSPQQIEAHNKQVKEDYKREMEEENIKVKSENKKKKPGHVYFLEYEGQGIKIGYSLNVNERVKQLQIASPHKLNLIAICETDTPEETESFFHNYFSDKKIRGEWYSISKKDIQKIM